MGKSRNSRQGTRHGQNKASATKNKDRTRRAFPDICAAKFDRCYEDGLPF
jgi:hypothetical protein